MAIRRLLTYKRARSFRQRSGPDEKEVIQLHRGFGTQMLKPCGAAEAPRYGLMYCPLIFIYFSSYGYLALVISN